MSQTPERQAIRSVRSLARCQVCFQLWSECGCDDDERFPDYITDDAASVTESERDECFG